MIIYHHAKPIIQEAAVGAALRPLRLLDAMREVGEEVIEITGPGPARVKKAARIPAVLPEDAVFYSESVVVPPALTWIRRRPWRMNFDYNLIRNLHQRGVPTGLFYRDIYWVLEETKAVSLRSFIRHRLTPAFARRELKHYERSLDVLFLPHKNMMHHVPGSFPDTEIRTLPPGGELRELSRGGNREEGRLNLLYVGNIAPPHYDLRPYIKAMDEIDCATMDVITRENALAHHGELYKFDERTNVTVSHAHGEGLHPFYGRADLALAVRDDNEYLAFAMPVKIFEAISFGVPLVVSAGLKVVAELVKRENLGWVVESPQGFHELLRHLADSPAELEAARARVVAARERHSWKARARKILEVLRNARG
jgi:glycosyltransferase involved in cell wall biosynthesis